jgi:hypothetical protein
MTAWVDRVMIEEGQSFLREVRRASHLTDDSPLDLAYYIRHRIETVWRIWLTAKIDAMALAHMVEEDYQSARRWSRYIADELDHDVMFLADLAEHGLSVDDVRATAPFAATRAMMADIEREIGALGSAPAVAYSLFVEWNAERFSARAVAKARASFSDRHVDGARRHAEFDLRERHLPMILEIAHRLLVRTPLELDTLERLVRSTAGHFRAYFRELDAATATP